MLIKIAYIYLLVKVFDYAVPLLLLPILTYYLSPEDYGVVGTYSALFGIVTIFVSMGSGGAIARAYADRHRSKVDFSAYIFNAMFINTFLMGISVAPVMFAYVSESISLPFELVLFTPLIVLLSTLKSFKQSLWNLQEKEKSFAIFQVCYTLIAFLSTLLLVTTWFQTWEGRLYAIFASEIVFTCISIYYLLSEDGIKYSFNKQYIYDVVKFGLPLVPHSMGLMLLSSSDKLVINAALGLQDVGIYSVAFAISSAALVFVLPVEQALNPYIYKLLNNFSVLSQMRFIAGFMFYVMAVSIGIGIMFIFLPLIFDYLIAYEYREALDVLYLLLLGQWFHSLYRYFIKTSFVVGKTYYVSLITVLSGICSFLAQIYLVQDYSLYGVAMAVVIGHSLTFFLSFYVSCKLFPINIRLVPSSIMHMRKLFSHKASL